MTRTGTIEPGCEIGHYTILSRLGQGGMGEVFRARDRTLDRQVAVKVLSADVVAGDGLRLFQREARALAALNHPNIVTIFSVEEVESHHLLVMEFVEGRTLRDLLQSTQLSLQQFFDIVIPLCDALAVAHEQGVTHRDLKPENVMVTRSGRVKVLDFGLAKIVQPARTPSEVSSLFATIAGPGAVLGTIPYLSPEQAEGHSVDQRSDIFSLGILIHELATGHRPFKGDSQAQVVASILRDPPEPLERVRPDVPPALGDLVRRCLEKDPQRRFQSAYELRRELKDLADQLLPLRPPAPGRARSHPVAPPPAGRSPQARSLLTTRVGLTGLLGVVFVVNVIETAAEGMWQRSVGVGGDLTHAVARAQSWFEGGIAFDRHDLTNVAAVYGYSSVYFFVLPAMIALAGVAFARRRDIRPYRVFSLALVVTYAASLLFYLLFPVPERWAFPESEAVLLSDLWSSWFIAAIRPISGLDNCFPSFHAASAIEVAVLCYVFGARFRAVAACAAAAVLLSTFALGIHWLPDIVAGACLGVTAVVIALRVDERLDAQINATTVMPA